MQDKLTPKIHLDTFADMLSFPTKPGVNVGEQTEFPMSLMLLSQLDNFPDHDTHFPLYTGDRLDDMVSSIRRFGVQTPILVWQTEDGRFIIISGHNRVNASRIAGLTKIPAIVRADLTAESAEELFYEMNFRQRSLADMRFSQRVLCVAAHYNLLKRQGKRTDLDGEATSSDSQSKLRTDARVAEEYELTRDKIFKYCRYATLYRPLLQLMDQGKQLGQLAAYEISFIMDEGLQKLIYRAITEDGVILSKGFAKFLRGEYVGERLNESSLKQLLEEGSKLLQKRKSG